MAGAEQGAPAMQAGLDHRFADSQAFGGLAASSSTCCWLSGYFDVALRDFGLSLGALALARLAEAHAPAMAAAAR